MRRALDPRLAAALAVGLIGVALAVVLGFGRLHYPAFPSLREHPDTAVPGTIAYLRWSEGDYGSACVWAVEASGAHPPRRLRCEGEASGPLEWRDGELAVTEHDRHGVRTLWLDPATGEVLRTEPQDAAAVPPRPPHPVSGELHTDSRDGTVKLWLDHGGGRKLVASATGPRDYHWWFAASSPDGDYAVVSDSARRLLIVRLSDGLVRLLATDAADPAWGATGA